MSNSNQIFSQEYLSDSGTEFQHKDKYVADEKKDETEATPQKYGLSKPRRRTIRGKVIHD